MVTKAPFHYCEDPSLVPPPLRGAAVAIGNFDGFHRGHQAVMRALQARARATGVPAVVLSFEPHPRDFFGRAEPLLRLTDRQSKRHLACALGLDGLVILDFDRELSEIEPEDFVARFLVRDLACTSVVVGANFRFGRRRRGDIDLLKAMGSTLGFSVDAVELGGDQTGAFSSTRVRAALAAGDVELANEMLGFCWFVDAVQASDENDYGQLLFRNRRLERVAPGRYAIRGACGPWPVEGVARINEDCPGTVKARLSTDTPVIPAQRLTFSILRRLDLEAAELGASRIDAGHFSPMPSPLDRAIGLI